MATHNTTSAEEWENAWAAWAAIEQECEASPECGAPSKSSNPAQGTTGGRRRTETACAHGAAAGAGNVRPHKAQRIGRSACPTGNTDGSRSTQPQAKCISMHQPWASLLVAGIKTVEGRSWSTTYRGPLWIASTVKKCDTAAADRARLEYATYTGSTEGFPTSFPSASLLGLVDVRNCLARDEWQRCVQRGDLKDERNDSSFLFVCDCPRQLTIPLPVRGMHRIWSLPASTAMAATLDLTESGPHPTQIRPRTAVVSETASTCEVLADPARAKVRSAFAKALSIDKFAASTPVRRPALRAAEVESALFVCNEHNVSDAYKERARSLLFNLRDALNAPLRESLLSGKLPARTFVAMDRDELANPKLQAANKALDAAILSDLVLSNSGGCETEGMFMCPNCGCEKTRHFVDYKAQGRKAEVWGTGQGADEDATTMSRVRACSKAQNGCPILL